MRDNWQNTIICAAAAAALSLFGGVQDSAAEGCKDVAAECVEVEFPGSKGRPKVDKDVLRLKKQGSSGDPNKFAFGTRSSDGDNALVIFKCQDEEASPPDCRTPAVHQNGNEKWVLQMNAAGSAAVTINGTLELCDSCEEKSNTVDYEECVKKYCRYPYMIVDRRGERPPLDPDVIIDPR